MADQARLDVNVWPQSGALVVRPRGELVVATYAQLRDCLLKAIADQPLAVIVELGELRVRSPALLSVFASVWMRSSTWTDVPLVLAATSEPVRSMLLRSGVQRFVAVHSTTAQAWASVAEPPPRRRAELSLGTSGAGSRRARQFVRELCDRWRLDAISGDAELVVSALVDNATIAGGSALVLRIEQRRGALAVAVRGEVPTSRRPCRGLDDLDGSFGLTMVDRLCVAWGRAPTTGGELTWAVLPLGGDQQAVVG